jgi:hypothetical protein
VEADMARVSVAYTVNGHHYASTIQTGYKDAANFEQLQDEAVNGSLEVAYAPSNPGSPRPAFEFTSGNAGLCTQ